MSSYQPGDFIQHHEYGVGRVSAASQGSPPQVEIDFKGSGPRLLTEHLLNRSASRLSPDGFHAFAYLEPDQAARLLQEDPVEAVCRVLEDFRGRRAKTEDFKDYLSPYLDDWGTWWESTRRLLKESPRIDSTKSHLREYGLLQQELPPAQAAYRSFCRYRKYEAFPLVYDQARRVLRELEKGGALEPEEIEDLLGYFRQLIASDQAPIGERLDAFFRLLEGKWLSPEQTQIQLAELLRVSFRINDLDAFVQARVVEYLIQRPLDDVTLELLATGMGGQAAVIHKLQNWAVRRSDPDVIARLLVIALSQALPPELDENSYPDLKARLLACVELAQCLPSTSPDWPEIFSSFRRANQAIGAARDLKTVIFLLPALVKLAWELHLRASQRDRDKNIVLDILTNPGLRIEYILALLDAISETELPADFSDRLHDRLFAELRSDDFLLPLVSRRWESCKEQVAGLAGMIERCSSTALVERAGRLVCELARNAPETELVDLLPYLDSFHRLPGDWSWSEALEGLREKAYFEYLISPSLMIRSGPHQDSALLAAVQQVVEQRVAEIQRQNDEQRDRLSRYQIRIHELESQLKEKEAVLSELRSSSGAGSKEGRFEERSRILKELVAAIAEFERYAASQPSRSREIQGVLRRLENLAASYQVIPQEAIGSQVAFNPQRHRLAESADLSPGEPVMVVERGFLIRDLQDRLRLLKPALVVKP